MRKLWISFVVFSFAILSMSCGEGNSESQKFDFSQDKPGINKSLAADDPNTNPNWDWYSVAAADTNYTLRYYPCDNASSGIQTRSDVKLPYFSHDQGTIAAMECDDYLPEDGWVLLLRNFGDRDAPNIPFYILYNKPKGLMRIFFYYTGDASTYAVVKICSVNKVGSDRSALFSYSKDKFSYNDNYYDEVLTDENNNIVYKTVNGVRQTTSCWNGLQTIAEAVPNKWGIADFILNYDPSITPDSNLAFELYSIDDSKITLSGKAELENLTKEKKNSNIADICKNLGGIFRDISDVVKKLQKSPSKSNNYTGKKIAPVVVFAAVGTAIQIGGKIYSIWQSRNNKSTVVVDTWYDINLKGSIVLNKQIDSFLMRIPGSTISTTSYAYQPLYDYPLGVFNIESSPKIAKKQIIISLFDKVYSLLKDYKIVMGVQAPLRLVFNNIPGYTVESVKVSFLWDNTDNNIKANSIDGSANYKDPQEWYNSYNIYYGKPINFNDLVGNGAIYRSERKGGSRARNIYSYDPWSGWTHDSKTKTRSRLQSEGDVKVSLLIRIKSTTSDDYVEILKNVTPEISYLDYNPNYTASLKNIVNADVDGDHAMEFVTVLDDTLWFADIDSLDGKMKWQTMNKSIIDSAKLYGKKITDLKFSDFNGDGKCDVACISEDKTLWVTFSDGRYMTGWKTMNGENGETAYTGLTTIADLLFYDFNNDGKTDMAKIYSDKALWITLSDGTQMKGWHSMSISGTTSANVGDKKVTDLRFNDFNGDGKLDVAYAGSDGSLWVNYSDGEYLSGWQSMNMAGTKSASLNNKSLSDIRFGDFNGDGITDMLYIGSDGYLWSNLSNGSYMNGWTSMNTAGTDSAYAFNQSISNLMFIDLNNDKRTDVMRIHTDGALWQTKSMGSCFLGWFTMNISHTSSANVQGKKMNELKFIDYNGDGYVDLALFHPDGTIWVSLSNGQCLSGWQSLIYYPY